MLRGTRPPWRDSHPHLVLQKQRTNGQEQRSQAGGIVINSKSSHRCIRVGDTEGAELSAESSPLDLVPLKKSVQQAEEDESRVGANNSGDCPKCNEYDSDDSNSDEEEYEDGDEDRDDEEEEEEEEEESDGKIETADFSCAGKSTGACDPLGCDSSRTVVAQRFSSSQVVHGCNLNDTPEYHDSSHTSEDQNRNRKTCEPPSKRERRLARNRHTARERRKRKALLTIELERTVKLLTTENNELRCRNKRLKDDLCRFGDSVELGAKDHIVESFQNQESSYNPVNKERAPPPWAAENRSEHETTVDKKVIVPPAPADVEKETQRFVPDAIASCDTKNETVSKPPQRDARGEKVSVRAPERDATQRSLITPHSGYDRRIELGEESTCPSNNPSAVATLLPRFAPFLGRVSPADPQLLLEALLRSTEGKALNHGALLLSREQAGAVTPPPYLLDTNAGPASRLLGKILFMQQERLENQRQQGILLPVESELPTQGIGNNNVELSDELLGMSMLCPPHQQSYPREIVLRELATSLRRPSPVSNSDDDTRWRQHCLQDHASAGDSLSAVLTLAGVQESFVDVSGNIPLASNPHIFLPGRKSTLL